VSWRIDVHRDTETSKEWIFMGQGPTLVAALQALLGVLAAEAEVLALLEKKE
jgi:hypothetical protein